METLLYIALGLFLLWGGLYGVCAALLASEERAIYRRLRRGQTASRASRTPPPPPRVERSALVFLVIVVTFGLLALAHWLAS